MAEFTVGRRTVLRGAGAAGALSVLSAAAEAARADEPPVPDTDPHTRLTYAAVVDAVVPRTPALATELGAEHVPGGLAVGLDAYLVTYVNDLFSGLTRLGDRTGDLRLAEPVALVLEAAAVELVATGGNEDAPSPRFARELCDRSTTIDEVVDVAAGGLFPRLSRRDRLNALTLLDELAVDLSVLADRLPVPLVESDGGLVPTLVVGFTEVIYYSEWQGYADFTAPPSGRAFTDDPGAVQSWRQSGYPGNADGYAAFRGYWGDADRSLGAGEHYRDSGDHALYLESGEFRDNDYDTSDYEERYATEDTADSPLVEVGGTDGNLVDTADEALGDGDGTVEVGADEGGLLDNATGWLGELPGGEG